YVVLKVFKSPRRDVKQLVFESEAPWATLAMSQFYQPPPIVFSNAGQVLSATQAILKSLQDEAGLLKKEKRFSKLDRAVALTGFAKFSLDYLGKGCKTVGATDSACGLEALAAYIDQIHKTFNLTTNEKGDPVQLPADLMNLIAVDANLLKEELARRARLP